MKAHIGPGLETVIEFNKKHGTGFQARMIMTDGGKIAFSSLLDSSPFTLQEAYAGTVMAIEEINKETGYNYDPLKTIKVAHEGLEKNRNHDFYAAKLYKDLQYEVNDYIIPEEDVTTAVVDGEEGVMLTARGVVTFTLASWKDEPTDAAESAVHRYCEYLAMKGIGYGTTALFEGLKGMDVKAVITWGNDTFNAYVTDKLGVLNYVMQKG